MISLRTSLIALSLLFVTIPPYGLQAAATRFAYLDAFATARGNAFTATADNASAIFYNAAGLIQIEGTEFRANLLAISATFEYEGDFGASDDIDDAFQPIPSLYIAHNFEDLPIAVGFGAYAPFALGTDWGSDASFASGLLGVAVPYEGQLAYVKYQPTLSWQINNSLSVGIGVSFDDSDVELLTNALEYEGDDQTFGYTVSVLWRPSEQHSFGLNYQAKTELTYEGTAQGLLTMGFPVDAQVDLIFPESIVAGYAYKPNEKWNFEFNLDWTNWDRVNELTIDGVPAASYQLNWISAYIWEFGATRFFENGWHLSAGYTFVENAIPDDDFLPIVPDEDRHFFSIGVGQDLEHFFWMLTFQQAVADPRRVSGNNFPTVNGDYDLDSTAFSLSLGYRF
ncbi:MAG: outer membrane protein transport protein [Verrucomicrobiota bacterium]